MSLILTFRISGSYEAAEPEKKFTLYINFYSQNLQCSFEIIRFDTLAKLVAQFVLTLVGVQAQVFICSASVQPRSRICSNQWISQLCEYEVVHMLGVKTIVLWLAAVRSWPTPTVYISSCPTLLKQELSTSLLTTPRLTLSCYLSLWNCPVHCCTVRPSASPPPSWPYCTPPAASPNALSTPHHSPPRRLAVNAAPGKRLTHFLPTFSILRFCSMFDFCSSRTTNPCARHQ